MEENNNQTVSTSESPKTAAENKEQKGSGVNLPLIAAAIVLVLAGLIYLFIRLSPETTGKIRDISLIIYVLESVVTVTALVVLIIQAARLINFLKYEVAPILKTTDKTVKKISGTVSFLSENAVEPVVNTASTVSGFMNAANTVLSIFKK
ncbi:MAG: hypothetical protein IJI57_15855 [Flexilinea sp.]|nr:hypothetical protein [Flexilinea sp.]